MKNRPRRKERTEQTQHSVDNYVTCFKGGKNDWLSENEWIECLVCSIWMNLDGMNECLTERRDWKCLIFGIIEKWNGTNFFFSLWYRIFDDWLWEIICWINEIRWNWNIFEENILLMDYGFLEIRD